MRGKIISGSMKETQTNQLGDRKSQLNFSLLNESSEYLSLK